MSVANRPPEQEKHNKARLTSTNLPQSHGVLNLAGFVPS